MMKIFIIAVLLLIAPFGFSQKRDKKNEQAPIEVKQEARKIVMQLTSGDTTVHKMLMKQLSNIMTVAPDTKIEVVCHGPGLTILVESKTIVGQKIQESKSKGVDFVACQYSMTERKVNESELVKEARIVEAGIIEVVDKQNAGWAYIKAG